MLTKVSDELNGLVFDVFIRIDTAPSFHVARERYLILWKYRNIDTKFLLLIAVQHIPVIELILCKDPVGVTFGCKRILYS